MDHVKSPGQVEISFRYSRHVGPTYIQGGLTLRFDSLKPYAFISRAQWTGTDNYEIQIREAVEDVLREHQGNLECTLVVLEQIEWDDIASCEVGFRRAATAATQAAFNV